MAEPLDVADHALHRAVATDRHVLGPDAHDDLAAVVDARPRQDPEAALADDRARRSSMRPGTVFIGGVPMNWATNRFAGVSYTSRGVPTCWRRPAAMTAMRVAIVMASTWSWVT